MAQSSRGIVTWSSIRLRRSILAGAITVALTFVGVGATAMLASSNESAPLLMSVDRLSEKPKLAMPDPSGKHPITEVRLDTESDSDAIAATESARHSEVDIVFEGADDEIRWFNGRPIRPAGTMTMVVTAYSPDERSCGKWADGITASGYSVWTNGMKLVAADTSILPFGSLVSIPGYDAENVVPVLDRGGAIRDKRLDVLYPTHERALQWGVQELEVTIWEYADGKPNGFRQAHRRR